MTSVAKETFPSAPAPSPTAARKTTLRRIWQIPLLLAGLAAFALGVRSVMHAVKPVPFETHVKDIRNLLANGDNAKAIQQINNIADYYIDRNQQAQLQWLAGDAHYLNQVKLAAGTEGFTKAVEHYRQAVALGAAPTPLMNERWGLAALALQNYPLAIEKLEAAAGDDPDKLLPHIHELVDAYLATNNMPKAQNVVDRMLASSGKEVSVDDRSWGYCKKIEMALAARNKGSDSKPLEIALAAAKQAAIGMPERDPSGRILLWIGRAEYEQGNIDAAKTDLTAARQKFLVHHVDDGRAATLLGKIALAQQQLEAAGNLFQEVVLAQTRTPVWVAARFGRAQVLAAKDQPGDDMDIDYRFTIKELMSASTPSPTTEDPSRQSPEFVSIGEVRADLLAQYERYSTAKKLEPALDFLNLLAELNDKETPARAWALATTREGLALQLQSTAKPAPQKSDPTTQPATQPSATQPAPAKLEADALLAQAAEDYLRHAHLTTMQDDISGNSLWKAAQLFDQAGETMRSIAIYQQFTGARPRDARVPEGLLAIGRLYQSVGMFDKAIPVYEKNIEKNSHTPAAYTSAVNLARCYMMQGTEGPANVDKFKKAETALLSLVQDNKDLLPTANEYRLSLFTLGELYYRNSKWADAILRLEECIERYPDDKGIPRAVFMLAETYRKSAHEITEALKGDGVDEHRADLIKASEDRLERAGNLFGQVISLLDVDPEQIQIASPKPLPQLEEEYLRTAYMDRAQCRYALADYPGAIKFYDQTATRFSQDTLAVEAYLQIVNAYNAMHQPSQAVAAAERGRWVLKRIPDEAFNKGPIKLSREYYEQLLTLAKGP